MHVNKQKRSTLSFCVIYLPFTILCQTNLYTFYATLLRCVFLAELFQTFKRNQNVHDEQCLNIVGVSDGWLRCSSNDELGKLVERGSPVGHNNYIYNNIQKPILYCYTTKESNLDAMKVSFPKVFLFEVRVMFWQTPVILCFRCNQDCP